MDGIFVIKTLPKTFKIRLIDHYSQLYMHGCLMIDKIQMTRHVSNMFHTIGLISRTRTVRTKSEGE